jgi:ElaB/YqjD/DUF883 family membrane-anchored ribosome-binding protein
MVTSSGLPDSSSSASNTAPSDGLDVGSGHAPAPGGDNSVQREATDMFARVVQGAHDTVDRLAETAAPHVQRLSQGVDNASDTLHQRADQVRETGDEWAESLRHTVRENPLTALAAALAVGVIVARLTS